jgi:hypothetical protein
MTQFLAFGIANVPVGKLNPPYIAAASSAVNLFVPALQRGSLQFLEQLPMTEPQGLFQMAEQMKPVACLSHSS